MKISCTSREVMIIEFTKDELESCHLTYDKLNEDILKSKNIICTIISETQKISGENIPVSESTQVDILPDGEGGCLIIINNKVNGGEYEKLRIYESDSLDPVMDFAKHTKNFQSAQSSLFERSGEYRLLISGEKDIHLMCKEFLTLCAQGEKGRKETEENFACLIHTNALKILGGFASEK